MLPVKGIFVYSHVDDSASVYMNVSRQFNGSVVSHCGNAKNVRLGEQTPESVTTL